MPRAMSPALAAALASNLVWPAIFVELHFTGGAVYIWSGFGSISWNSHTWVGAGDLGSISVIEGGGNVEARGISLTLSGIDTSSTVVSDTLNQFQQGLPAIVYLATFTDATRTTLIADPFAAWTGRMDQPTSEEGAETSVLTISCESRLADMNVAVDRRYTQDDQQLRSPGDVGFAFVQGQVSGILSWGRSPSISFSP